MIILLLVSIFLSWKLYFYDYQKHDIVSINNFPMIMGEWTSEDIPISPIDLNFIERNNAFLRRYTRPDGSNIYLYILYSQSNPKATIPPEICYGGTDISILDKGKEPIIINFLNSLLKVNWLLLDNNRNQQIAYYWFKVGDIYTASYWKQQGLIAFNNIMNKRTGSALIRVSTDIIDSRHQKATELINEFVGLLMPRLSQYLP
jgi:EpsI family protein